MISQLKTVVKRLIPGQQATERQLFIGSLLAIVSFAILLCLLLPGLQYFLIAKLQGLDPGASVELATRIDNALILLSGLPDLLFSQIVMLLLAVVALRLAAKNNLIKPDRSYLLLLSISAFIAMAGAELIYYLVQLFSANNKLFWRFQDSYQPVLVLLSVYLCEKVIFKAKSSSSQLAGEGSSIPKEQFQLLLFVMLALFSFALIYRSSQPVTLGILIALIAMVLLLKISSRFDFLPAKKLIATENKNQSNEVSAFHSQHHKSYLTIIAFCILFLTLSTYLTMLFANSLEALSFGSNNLQVGSISLPENTKEVFNDLLLWASVLLYLISGLVIALCTLVIWFSLRAVVAEDHRRQLTENSFQPIQSVFWVWLNRSFKVNLAVLLATAVAVKLVIYPLIVVSQTTALSLLNWLELLMIFIEMTLMLVGLAVYLTIDISNYPVDEIIHHFTKRTGRFQNILVKLAGYIVPKNKPHKTHI